MLKYLVKFGFALTSEDSFAHSAQMHFISQYRMITQMTGEFSMRLVTRKDKLAC